MNFEIKAGEAPKEWYNQIRFKVVLECTLAELFYLTELVRKNNCDWLVSHNFLLLPSEADRDIVPSWMEQPGGELHRLFVRCAASDLVHDVKTVVKVRRNVKSNIFQHWASPPFMRCRTATACRRV